jgi:alpha-beta hydrolase superfamily lysophospholipase
MRYRLWAYVFFNVILFFHQTVASKSTDFAQSADLFSSYQNHIQASKRAVAGFTVDLVSFPVQQGAQSQATFLRKGFLAIRPDALGTIIICHGYTHSKHEAFFFKMLFSHFNVLAFDFRGHGELVEKGQFSTIGRDEVYDVLGAVEFVKSYQPLQGKPIIGFGFSMGAVSLLQAQAEFGGLFDMLILDSPFDSSSDCMEKGLDRIFTYHILGKEHHLPGKAVVMRILYSESMRPVIKKFFQWTTGMNPYQIPTKFVPVVPLKNASKVTIPCLFISCEQDKSVKVDSVLRLYESIQSPFKRLWITKGVKHCGSCLAQPELYAYKVNKFINKVLKNDFSIPEKIRDDRVSIAATV